MFVVKQKIKEKRRKKILLKPKKKIKKPTK